MNEFDAMLKRYGLESNLVPYAGAAAPVEGTQDFADLQARYNSDQAIYDAYKAQHNKQVESTGQYDPGWQGDVLKAPSFSQAQPATPAGKTGYYDYDPATGQWTWVDSVVEGDSTADQSYMDKLKAALRAGTLDSGGNYNFGATNNGGSATPFGTNVNDVFHSIQNAINTPLGAATAYAALQAPPVTALGFLGSMALGSKTQDPTNIPVIDAVAWTPAEIQAGAGGIPGIDNTAGYGVNADGSISNTSDYGGYSTGQGETSSDTGGDTSGDTGGGQAGNGATGGTGVGGTDHGGNDPGGDGDCVDPSTPVLLSDKTSKAAGSLVVGDSLYTMHENTFEFGDYPVVAISIIQAPRQTITFTCGKKITASNSHKFFTPNQTWVRVSELSPGDMVSGLHFPLAVKTIEDAGVADVVKLTVLEAHTYVAADLISHNKYARGGLVKLHQKYQSGGSVEVDPAPYGRGLDMSRVTPQQLAMMQKQDPAAMMRGIQRFAGQPAQPQMVSPEQSYAEELRAARADNQSAREELNRAILASASEKASSPSKAEMYFNLAAAFAAPTKTGSFGESLGNASQVMAGHQKATRESEAANRAQQQNLALTAAQARLASSKDDIGNLRALTVEEMKARRLANMPQSEVGKLAMDAGLQPGSQEYNQYVAEAARQAAQIKLQTANTAESRANLAATNATKLTTQELKLKEETEDTLGSADNALLALNKALEINPKTFSNSLGDLAQKYALQTVQPGHPMVKATEEQTNLLANQALSSMKSLVGGNPTEGERAIIMNLQGIDSKSLPVKETIIKNAIAAVQSRIIRNRKRLADINAGKYRETTPEAPVDILPGDQ